MHKNPRYLKFLKEGIIDIFTQTEIETAIMGEPADLSAFIIQVYLTGARPAECMLNVGRDVYREGNYYVIKLYGVKRGLPRLFYISTKNKLAQKFFDYAKRILPDQKLYGRLVSDQRRLVKFKSKKTGLIVSKEYVVSTHNIYYSFKRCFKKLDENAIPPYYLRHNRFSSMMMKGGMDSEIQHLKGGRTEACVRPYKHMSTLKSKKISRLID